jgi:CHAT domain-containing protein
MTDAEDRTCPGPETLAAFAEGTMKGARAAAIVEHLDTCGECTHEVALALQAAEEEENVLRPRRWISWTIGIAAAVVIALLVPLITIHRSPIARLAALTPKSARILEPRLSGGFAWSPYHGSERASGNAVTDPERMKLAGAAGELLDRAQHDPSADAQHDAGVAMVLTKNPVEGIARLETAAKEAPSAQTWSDLAAARYAAASDLGRAALYPQALAATDAALKLDPNLPEAIFNRALVLERMGLADEARAAWNRYLAADPSSKWADEVRTRLSELPAAPKSSLFQRDRPLLENAVLAGDEKTARSLISEHPAQASAYAESEYLARWGEGVLQKSDEANRWLTLARVIGAAAGHDGKDTLLRDAVLAIDAQPPSGQEKIAAAHQAFRAGRMAYGKQKLDEAMRELDRAAALFTESRSPMALAARYYHASVMLAMSDPGARAELERIVTEADAHPPYRALRAHVRWELGRARMFDYDWSGAAAALSEGAALFREVGDHASEASMESLLAYCLSSAGRGDEAWSSRIQALRVLSAEGNAGFLTAALDAAMRAERASGRNDAALALAHIPRAQPTNPQQLSLFLDGLQFESMLESATGDTEAALRTARHASTVVQTIADPLARGRRLADIDVATGAALAVSNPSAALAPLARAIEFYRRGSIAFALPEPLLLHARCAVRMRDTETAARDLEEGMKIVERESASSGSGGTGVLDADHALFTDAMQLSLDRGENAAAFAIAERSRGASLSVAELQARLSGSATAVIEFVVLPQEIATFAITGNDLQIVRRKRDAEAWPRLTEASLSENGTAAAATLYDDLIRPVDGVISRVRNVVIVPDPRLASIPFAALYDTVTGRYLVEREGIAAASSAASLQREIGHANVSVATVTLPTGGTSGTIALPEAGRELNDIASLYRRATAIPAEGATLAALRDAMSSADVVHIAGHTERQPDGGEHALLLAGTHGGFEPASSRSVGSMRFPNARLVVLGACETLRPPASAETHALSIGAAFTAAGVPEVIGTLTPVGDRDARLFFRALHQHLATGDGAGEALRTAQIEAIQDQKTGGGSRAWRSVALWTRRVYTTKG